MDISPSDRTSATSSNDDFVVISNMNGSVPNFTVVVCNDKTTETDNVYLNNYFNPIICDTISDEQYYNHDLLPENDIVMLDNENVNLHGNVIPDRTLIEYSADDVEFIENSCQIIDDVNDSCIVIENFSEPGSIGDGSIQHDSHETQANEDLEDLELEKYVTFLVNDDVQAEENESSLEPACVDKITQNNVNMSKNKLKDIPLNSKVNSKEKIVLFAGTTVKVAMEKYGPDVTSKNVYLTRFFCSLCNYDYASKTILKQHVDSKHLKDKKNVRLVLKIVRLYSCEYCNNCFLGRKKLQIHVNKIHNESNVSEMIPRRQKRTFVDTSGLDQSGASITAENIDKSNKYGKRSRKVITDNNGNETQETGLDKDIGNSHPRSLLKTLLTSSHPHVMSRDIHNESNNGEQLNLLENTDVAIATSDHRIRSLRNGQKSHIDHQRSVSSCNKESNLKSIVKLPSQNVVKKSNKTIRNKKLKPVSTLLTKQEMLDTPQTKFYCELCDRYFRNDKMLQVHSRLTHPYLYEPEKIDTNVKSINKNVELCDLVESVSEPCHFCPVCDAPFAKITSVQNHININHPHDDFEVTCQRITKRNTSITKCKICKEQIRSVYSHYITKHRKTYTKDELTKFQLRKRIPQKKIIQKEKNVNTEISWDNLNRICGRAWKCDVCFESFKNKYALRDHMDMKHLKSVDKKSCSIDIKKSNTILDHNSGHVTDLKQCVQIVQNTDETATKDKRQTYSHIKNNSTTSEQNFINIQVMRYACSVCNTHFSCSSSIYKHICLKHTNANLPVTFKNSKFQITNIFKCTWCSTLCVSKESHLQKCEILLDKKRKHRYFDKNRSMFLPIASVDSISCDYCTESQSKYSKLQLAIHSMDQHVHILENNNVKFGTKIVVHKYNCQYCPESYKALASLNKHEHNVHSEMHYSSTATIPSEVHLWKCQLCYKETSAINLFNSAVNFLKHLSKCHDIDAVDDIASIHTDCMKSTKLVYKFECLYCNWYTLCKLSMSKHVQKHTQWHKCRTNKFKQNIIELKLCKKCLKYFIEDTDLKCHKSNCNLQYSAFKAKKEEVGVESNAELSIDNSNELDKSSDNENLVAEMDSEEEHKEGGQEEADKTVIDNSAITLENCPPTSCIRIRFVCPYCPKHFSFKPSALDHMKKSHKGIDLIGKIKETSMQIYSCALCSNYSNQKYFESINMYEMHVKEKHDQENFTKQVTTEIIESNKIYPDVKLTKTLCVEYFCTLCNSHFVNKQSLNCSSHLKLHNDKLEKVIRKKKMMWVCNLCDVSSNLQHFGSKKLYMSHLMVVHKLYVNEKYLEEDSETVSESEENTKKKGEMSSQETWNCCCDLCDQKFDNQHELRQHMVQAHKINIVNRDKVIMRTPIVIIQKLPSNSIENDTNNVHKTLKVTDGTFQLKPNKYTCSTCDQKLDNQHELRQHMVQTHKTNVVNSDKKIMKDSIVIIQTLPSKLIENDTKVTNDTLQLKPNKYMCSICLREFELHRNLENHMKYKHLKFKKCSKVVSSKTHCCKKINSIPENTEEIMKFNDLPMKKKVKAFLCPECKKPCKRLIILKEHFESKHSNVLFNPSVVKVKMVSMDKCKICPCYFFSRKILIHHELNHEKNFTPKEKVTRKSKNDKTNKKSEIKKFQRELEPTLGDKNKNLHSDSETLDISHNAKSQLHNHLTDHTYCKLGNNNSQTQTEIYLNKETDISLQANLNKSDSNTFPIVNMSENNSLKCYLGTVNVKHDMIIQLDPYVKDFVPVRNTEFNIEDVVESKFNINIKKENKLDNLKILKIMSIVADGKPIVCDYCKLQFSHLQSFIDHVNTHLKFVNQENIEIVVTPKMELNKKTNEPYCKQMNYTCLLCDLNFRLQGEREKHYHDCHDVFFCVKCNEFFPLSMFNKHRNSHTNTTIQNSTICKP